LTTPITIEKISCAIVDYNLKNEKPLGQHLPG
jgi:hypothetical protein